MNHWTKDNCINDAKHHKTRTKWQKNSSSAYSSAARNDWLDECCIHMPKPKTKVKRKPLKWHYQACIEDALNYTNRSTWQKKSNSAYNSAKNNDWLEDCCKHMALKKGGSTKRKKISQYWHKDDCLREARKYKNVSQWQTKSGSSYQAALRNSWVEECKKLFKGC